VKKILFAFLLILSFSGCDKDSDPIAADIFTVHVDPDYYSEYSWVAVRISESGELIDYKKTDRGATMVFSTSKSIPNNKIDVVLIASHINSGAPSGFSMHR